MKREIADCGLRIADSLAIANGKSPSNPQSAFRNPHYAIAALLALFILVPVLQPGADAQLPGAPDDRFAGLQWRFVRIKYHHMFEGSRVAQDFYGEP